MQYHFGGSPGGGITDPMMSCEPLATEEEATVGPDDYNPYREREVMEEIRALERRASAPRYENEFVDDVPPPSDPSMAEPSFTLEFELPSLASGSGPRLPDF